MHSLPVLLIALALLPFSAGLKCKTVKKISGFPEKHKHRNEESEDKNGTECAYYKEYCGSYYGVSDDGVTWDEKGCGTYCGHGEGCIKQGRGVNITDDDKNTIYAIYGNECCCKGDMCTPPPQPPLVPRRKKADNSAASTTLLPLAAVVAVIAAMV